MIRHLISRTWQDGTMGRSYWSLSPPRCRLPEGDNFRFSYMSVNPAHRAQAEFNIAVHLTQGLNFQAKTMSIASLRQFQAGTR